MVSKTLQNKHMTGRLQPDAQVAWRTRRFGVSHDTPTQTNTHTPSPVYTPHIVLL